MFLFLLSLTTPFRSLFIHIFHIFAHLNNEKLQTLTNGADLAGINHRNHLSDSNGI